MEVYRMYTVQFKDGDWHEHRQFVHLGMAQAEMQRGIESDSTGPWRIIDRTGKVVESWPSK